MDTPSSQIPPGFPEEAADGCPYCGQAVAVPTSSPVEDAPCVRCGQLLWFLRQRVDGIVVLTFLPGLITGRESIERIDEVIAATEGASRVLLDFSPLRFLSSLLLGMLVQLHQRMTPATQTLRLCGLRPEAREVFRVTKLDQTFDLYADRQSALKGF